MYSSSLVLGPFKFKINSSIKSVKNELELLYQDFTPVTTNDFIDFNIDISKPNNFRRWIKPQVNFVVDEHYPFKPLPLDHAFPMLEWGMNWCIASNAHQYFILHAGAVERNGCVIVLPAHSGAGKSTLTASLVYRGWRLFSDELALFSLKDKLVYPLARPINLKNQSIEVIKNFLPESIFSQVVKDTHKGTVALLKPPKASVEQSKIPAAPSHFIFPKYVEGSSTKLKPCSVEYAFKQIIEQGFNYHILGEEAFVLISHYLRNSPTYTLEYSDFEQANTVLRGLVD
ncbi:HprK-related kinase A [Catenovulum adriaticum]|uniref:HprK-related kinase A n=1 Tax=Catenovulum adriaticum TaxID=2984846 RepID=A0ABY7AR01_9ALTE|nr:HprK-related kinase A [Catenovulum sp. TS8]WAJ70676.1 HprK-related kinase A [Catenovulum sp. TS8]